MTPLNATLDESDVSFIEASGIVAGVRDALLLNAAARQRTNFKSARRSGLDQTDSVAVKPRRWEASAMMKGLSGRGVRPRSIKNQRWRQLCGNLGTAIALTALYFLLTQLSRGLMRSSQPVFSFFWPPTGFAAAVLICTRPPTRWLFLLGASVAYILTELVLPIENVSLGEIGMFAVGNVAEPIVTATLVKRFLGVNFSIERSRDLLGLFAAALVGVTVSATWYTLAYKLALHPSIAAVPVWLELFLAHLVGFVTIGPLVIELFAAARNPPPSNEVVEGILAVLGIVLVTGLLAFLPPEYWNTVTPVALLLPILLWLAFRSRPLFSAAAVFSLAMSLVWITIFKIGHIGDANLATRERLLQVQAIILVAAVSALVLSVLFAERKDNEARLAGANAKLKREQDNRLMNLEAVAAAISHEIKQPLATIVANADALQILLSGAPPELEEARSTADELVGDSHRIGQTIDNLNQLFSKSDHSKDFIDLNELVHKVVQDSSRDLTDRGITALFNPAPDLPLVAGHKGQLEEVLLNLIRNAIEAMASPKVDRRALKLRTKVADSNAIVVEIEDSGPGFDPGLSERIFDAFVTTKPRGVGLGLAICRAIIDRHDGRLTAESDGRSGALFRVLLPTSIDSRGLPRTSWHRAQGAN